MKRHTIAELSVGGRHILEGILGGRHIGGGLGYKKPGQRTHDEGCQCPSCRGTGRHVHDDAEIFIFLEGKAVMQIDGREYEVAAGDVIVAEGGEDHHVVADREFPCVNLWFHLRDTPQYAEMGST